LSSPHRELDGWNNIAKELHWPLHQNSIRVRVLCIEIEREVCGLALNEQAVVITSFLLMFQAAPLLRFMLVVLIEGDTSIFGIH